MQSTANRLAVGPLSPEIVEVTYEYSHSTGVPLMFCVSRNQIDYDSGYTGWRTKTFMKYLDTIAVANPNARVRVCRDHCGPGFNGHYDMDSVFTTLRTDIECGFDLEHIDLSRLQESKKEIQRRSILAVLYCRRLRSGIGIELGTDDVGKPIVPSVKELERQLVAVREVLPVDFYVVSTGTWVLEDTQLGRLYPSSRTLRSVLNDNGLRLKEHNADYMEGDVLKRHASSVDAMNICPELGVVQTRAVLSLCAHHNIPTDAFRTEVCEGGSWKKWDYSTLQSSPSRQVEIAGHYHYDTKVGRALLGRLWEKDGARNTVKSHISKVIHRYAQVLYGA